MENTTLAVQSIPISKIKPNANNPRHVIHPQVVETLAASMKAVGQETPIKVRKITEKPEIAASPTEPIPSKTIGDKSGSAPRNDSDYEFELVGGHIRLEAAKSLGWETLNALVLDLTPDQAELAALLDNQGEDMHWLDWYQAIERRLSALSQPTQQRVAEELGVTQSVISRASNLMKLLSQGSRNLIYQNLIIEGGYQVSENAVFRLTDLGDPTLIEKALGEVITKGMTEPQVAEMVKAINQGEQPGEEALNGTGVASTPRLSPEALAKGDNDSDFDSFAEYWKDLPKGVKVKMTKKGYRVVMNLAAKEAVNVVMNMKAQLDSIRSQATEANMPPMNADKWDGKGQTKPFDGVQGKPNLFGQLKQALKDQVKKITPEAIEDNLAKDAKQAANYQIRRGIRNILKDMF